MSLQIIKNPAALPELNKHYYRHASVEVIQKTGLKKFFGPREGTVSLAPEGGSLSVVIRIVPPAWQKGEKDEWTVLQQCYEQALQLAERQRCSAVVLPLLTQKEPEFPAYIDFKIAVDTIQAFLEEYPMDVFLLATGQAVFRMPELRRDVERFLSRNFWDLEQLWGSSPLPADESRFQTLSPGMAPAETPVEDRPCRQESVCFDAYAPTAPCSKAAQAPMSRPFAVKRREAQTETLPGMSELEAMLRATDAGFSETLLKLIDKSGKKDSEVYNKANVSRQHFSKIRNNPAYKPTKPTAIAFAIALELDLDQTRDLIGRAGYALTNSSKFDVIIMYFIQKRNYNMYDINETLYEFDQSLLGA